MAHHYERVVDLISRMPEERDDKEVDLLIPWFQNMSGLFKAQKIDVVKDIVRNCDFLSAPADTVIIKQGAKGDCFYIILSGSVSVHINQALEEQGNVSQSTSSRGRRSKSRLERPNTRGKTPNNHGNGRQSVTKQTASSSSSSSTSSSSLSSSNLGNGHLAERNPSISSSEKSVKSQGSGQDITNSGESDKTQGDVQDAVTGSDDSRAADDKMLCDESGAKDKDLTNDRGGEDGSLSHSQVDSGRSSGNETVDENDNHVYVDQNDKDDSDDIDSDFEGSTDDGEEEDFLQKVPSATKIERSTFGVHIRELGAGKCFGELALVQTNLTRTASIITNQLTNLIVIDRELYNRSLKAAQQHEFNLKKDFVNTFPLFRNWTPRQRSVMAMSLTRYQYQYGNTIARQGAPVKGLHFITQGSAKVSTDTVLHISQYPKLCTEKDVQFAKDVKTGRGTRTSHPGSRSWESAARGGGVQHCIRRKETYAQAERDLNYKNTDMCVIGNGDYIGDFEVLLRLPTYSFSVKCLQGVDAFELDFNNFERQIVKKNPRTFAFLRETAEAKLCARVKRLDRDQQIYMPVLEAMLNRLSTMNNPHGWKLHARAKQASLGNVTTTASVGDEVIGPDLPWREYREKQRQFLRRRQREKRLEEKRSAQMAHAASLGLQLQLQNTPRATIAPSAQVTGIDATIEKQASEIFPDLPSNVKLRVDPVTGLIRATEIRVPRSLVYKAGGGGGFPQGHLKPNGHLLAARSKRELLSALTKGNRSKARSEDGDTRSSQSVPNMVTNRLKNFTLTPHMHRTNLNKTTSASLSSLNSQPAIRRPTSGKLLSTHHKPAHAHRPASRSAGSRRPYPVSY